MWIEISNELNNNGIPTSRPARALWIEIGDIIGGSINIGVEAREGLVD